MRLYLIRHAHAEDHVNDAQRPVSERGRRTTRAVAASFRANGRLHPAQIWHSPLLRAHQTASELRQELDPHMVQVETDGLLPGDDPAILAERFRLYPTTHDVAVVGHQPHLASLASLLVIGRPDPALLHFKKNSVLALRRSDHVFADSGLPCWRIAWHFTPEFLPDFDELIRASAPSTGR